MEPQQRKEWLDMLNAPMERPAVYGKPKAVAARPSAAELQADSDAFMAAMTANQGG